MSLILFQQQSSNNVSVPEFDFAVTEWSSTGSSFFTEINNSNDLSYVTSPLNRGRMQMRFRMTEITTPTSTVRLFIRMKV